MAHRLVVGAGPIGSALIRRLAADGDSVTVVTRSGRGPDLPQVTRVAADATDAERLTALATGATTIFNCANPGDYTRWEAEWPPLAAALLVAAERSEATLVTLGNLYGYGPVDVPISRRCPSAGRARRMTTRSISPGYATSRAVAAAAARAADAAPVTRRRVARRGCAAHPPA